MAKKNFQLVRGDVDLISHVYRHRLTQIHHLSHLTDRPVSSLYSRLRWLSRGRPPYLYKIQFPFQKAHYLTGGRALDLLVEEGIAPREILAKRLRHHELTELFLKHLTMLTDIHVQLELATRQASSPLKLTAWEQGQYLVERLPAGKGADRAHLPFTPDAYFLLEAKIPTPESHPWLYFVEADRSTTSHKRFSGKFEAYSAYYRLGRHRERHNIPSFRVLTFTLTPARAQNLSRLAYDTLEPDVRRLFYFGALPSFTPEDPGSILRAPFWAPRAHPKPGSFLPTLPHPTLGPTLIPTQQPTYETKS